MAAAVLIAATVSIPSASANGKLDQILANMQREASKIKTLSAKMVQETIQVELGGTSTSRAFIFFKHEGKDDKVRITYEKPKGQVVWVNGDDIVLYQGEINQAVKTTRSKQATKNPEISFVGSPYKSIPQLKSKYNVVYLGDENGFAKLELTPKASSSMKKEILWVDQTIWLPVKGQVHAVNGDITTITLSEMKPNSSISDNMFKPTFKSGTKVIQQ
jgi:outer membrane lipoprotein-sorting protein